MSADVGSHGAAASAVSVSVLAASHIEESDLDLRLFLGAGCERKGEQRKSQYENLHAEAAGGSNRGSFSSGGDFC
jgi:hypothetical protein